MMSVNKKPIYSFIYNYVSNFSMHAGFVPESFISKFRPFRFFVTYFKYRSFKICLQH